MDRVKSAAGNRQPATGRVVLLLLLALTSPAAAQTDSAVRRLALDLVPSVERATGLTFKRPPRIYVRSREQLRRYLETKTRTEPPPAEQRAQERVYRAFGAIPDSLNLMQVQLDLLQEQVAGFFDPDSAALFVIRGADAMMLRLVVAHELVHALQDQYMRLQPIMDMRRQEDRQMAARAILEGQATLAGLLAMAPGITASQIKTQWESSRGAIRAQRESATGMLGAVPRLLRESLIFPYLNGAEFMLYFDERRSAPDEMPYGARMPVTTEQILHPSKYTTREGSLPLRFAATPGDTLIYDSDMGEFGIRTLLQEWGLSEADAIVGASGWNGDRYEVRGTRGGTVIVWAVAFDTERDAQEFERYLRRVWERERGTALRGNRWQVDLVRVGATHAVRLTDAPEGWRSWTRLPALRAGQ
jgi:hypothetical protein